MAVRMLLAEEILLGARNRVGNLRIVGREGTSRLSRGAR
jgi:hypothetical protein